MARRHAEKGATPRSAARGARPVPVLPQPSKLDGAAALSEPGTGDPALLELAQLRRERDGLRSENEAMKARIAELEANMAQACNRLSWAIDSVQSILDGKG